MRLRDEACALLDRDHSSLFLGERFHRARVAYRTGAYSEFLTLMVGLQEAVLQSLALAELGIDYRDDNRSAREARQKQIDERTGLRDHLRARPTPPGRPLDYANSTRLVIRACLQYLLNAPTGNPEGLSLTPERKADLQELLAIEGRLEDTPGSVAQRRGTPGRRGLATEAR